MKLKLLTTLALGLGLTASGVFAQDGPPAGGPPSEGGSRGEHRPPPPFMAALDLNHDGTISADEIAVAAKSLMTLDKNGDGEISMEEFLGPGPGHRHKGPDGDQSGGPNGDQPPAPQGGQGDAPKHPPVPAIFAALDTNGDGVLSADEIANAPKALLTLDKNGDGQLTRDELRPAHRPPPPDGNNDK